jgi:hypothetical protein
MHGQEQLFSLTSLIELEGNYLNSELSSLHVQLCGDKEKEKNTRTQGAGARHLCEWYVEIRPKLIQAHNFLLHFIFVCVQCIFNRDTESVTVRLNPRRFFSINTCGRHTNHNSSHEPTNASRFSPPLLLCHQDFFIPIVDVQLRPEEQVFRTIVLSNHALRKGE